MDEEGPKSTRVLQEQIDDSLFWGWQGSHVSVANNDDEEDMQHLGFLGVHATRTDEQKVEVQSELSVSIVMAARAALNNNRSGGSDRVVPEIIKAIPPLLVYMVCWWFRSRLEGWSLSSAGWITMVVLFLK